MFEVIQSYGKTILICISLGAVFTLVFLGIRYEGKTGVIEAAGEQSVTYGQQMKDTSDLDDAYMEYLKTPGYHAQLVKELTADEVYMVKDMFKEEDSLERIVITGVYDYPSGEEKNEYLLQGGEQVCFQKSGLYTVEIWSLSRSNVETKQSFYLSVK